MTLTTFFARETPWSVMFSVFTGAVIVASGIIIAGVMAAPRRARSATRPSTKC